MPAFTRRARRFSGILATLFLAVATIFGGCGLIYTDVRTPHAYRSATPADVKAAPSDETVTGSACARAVLFLVAWGDAGYAAAIHDALGERAGAILYDVRTDIQLKSYVLGTYTKACTIVTGRIGRP